MTRPLEGSQAQPRPGKPAKPPTPSPALPPSAAGLQLPGLQGDSATALLAAANDFALVLSPTGLILQAWASDSALAQNMCAAWVGRRWAEVVSSECLEKIAALLLEAHSHGQSQRWRQVNHPLHNTGMQGTEDTVPVQYSAVTVRLPVVAGEPPHSEASVVLACGRDMRPAVQMQRRLVDAQQLMERDYWRFREAETRYRTLFQSSPDAVLIVEGPSHRVLEANPAAELLLGHAAAAKKPAGARPAAKKAGTSCVGQPLLTVLGSAAAEQVLGLMAQARNPVQPQTLAHEALPSAAVEVALAGQRVNVSVVLYRQEQVQYGLVRLVPLLQAADEDAQAGASLPTSRTHGAGAVAGRGAPSSTRPTEALSHAYAQQVSDAVVFTDAQGHVLSANPAFAALAQLDGAADWQGQHLGRWLGQTGVELGVLLGQLRQGRQVGSFATQVRGEFGAVATVDLSAVTLQLHGGAQPAQPALAFTLRDQGRRAAAEATRPVDDTAEPKLARSASELSELVGRMPMKDIVSETSDMIEKLCIEAALQMSRDNRALAAQLLGLSRQSLYVKLRRYGLGDLGDSRGDGEDSAGG
jgi:PAS domain-containing protein/DNA-binding protein Fis